MREKPLPYDRRSSPKAGLPPCVFQTVPSSFQQAESSLRSPGRLVTAVPEASPGGIFPHRKGHRCRSPALGAGVPATISQSPEPRPPPALIFWSVEGLAEGSGHPTSVDLEMGVGQGRLAARPGQRRLGGASCQELSSPPDGLGLSPEPPGGFCKARQPGSREEAWASRAGSEQTRQIMEKEGVDRGLAWFCLHLAPSVTQTSLPPSS